MIRKTSYLLICVIFLLGITGCSNQPDAADEVGRTEAQATLFPVLEQPEQAFPQENAPSQTQTPPQTQTPSQTPAQSQASELFAPGDDIIITAPVSAQVANLRKLCKVWGFVKYTHLAFLTGEKDWDQELLNLIPSIRDAAEDEVNGILYDWYISLGDDGYDSHSSSYFVVQTIDYADMSDGDELQKDGFVDLLGETAWESNISTTDTHPDHAAYILRVDDEYVQPFLSLAEEQNWIRSITPLSVQDIDVKPMADISWTTDETYLGAPLSAAFTRFRDIPMIDMSKAPVSANFYGISSFSNENEYTISFTSAGSRLLGLFRLWNAIEYYYPYKDIMDYDWDELLPVYIAEMIEGADVDSYWLALNSMSAKMNDCAVILFDSTYSNGITSTLRVRFSSELNVGSSRGYTAIPAIFCSAEGQVVVEKNTGTGRSSFLRPGDAVVSIDGIGIAEVLEDIKQFVPVPDDERISYILPVLSYCKNSKPEITVLRNGEELTDTVNAISWNYSRFQDPLYRSVKKSHELLSGNIGLINPMLLSADKVEAVMKELRNTNGLIIDMRQPSSNGVYQLRDYFLDGKNPYIFYSRLFTPIPGFFIDEAAAYADPGTRVSGKQNDASGGTQSEADGSYFYDKPVVVLMDQRSQFTTETNLLYMRTGPNITLLGSNSLGTNGIWATISIPGGATLYFPNQGVYTPDGGQTQRIGITPDIYVERTIEGIREGRDELMEAAIGFLLEQQISD